MATIKVSDDKRKFIAVIPKELDEKIRRNYVRKQSDLSKIGKEALELYIQAHPQPIDCEAT